MTSSKHLADEIYNMALSINRIAAMSYGTPQTFETGSPEAIADCQRRQREAQQKAHDALGQAATEQAGEYDPTDDDGFTA